LISGKALWRKAGPASLPTAPIGAVFELILAAFNRIQPKYLNPNVLTQHFMKTNFKSVTSKVNNLDGDHSVVISPRISSGFFRLMQYRHPIFKNY